MQLTPAQQATLEACQNIARAAGFEVIHYVPGRCITVEIALDTHLLQTGEAHSIIAKAQDPVQPAETHVFTGPPDELPKPVAPAERVIDPSKLPPKLASLYSGEGSSPEFTGRRECPSCGMPMRGFTCVECAITPAGGAGSGNEE